MHVRVVTAQIQPGKLDETIHIYQDSIGPAVKQRAGFRGTLLLIDQAACKAMLIALWESEADRRASEINGFYQQQVAKLLRYFVGTPVREDYEVGIQT